MLATLALLALTATADVPVSPPELAPAATGSWLARAVASDGRDFLAVWDDRRPSSPGLRVAVVRDGEPLPSNAIGAGFSKDAAAVWDGQQYIVAWSETKELTGPTSQYVARLDRDGALLGVTATWIDAYSVASVAIAQNGGDVAVAWNWTFGITIERLDRDGGVLAEPTIKLPSGWFEHLRLLRAGDGFVLLAARNSVGVVGWRLDRDGTPVDDAVMLLEEPPFAGDFGAAADGPRIVVSGLFPSVLRTRVFDADLTHGRALPDVSIPFAYTFPFAYRHTSLVCDGGCTAVVSGDQFVAGAGSLTVSVNPLRGTVGSPEELLSGSTDPPALAWNGSGYLVLWNTRDRLRMMACDGALRPRDGPRDVVIERKQQFHVTAASRGGRALAVWHEGVGTDPADLMTASFDGARMSAPVPLARGVSPAVAPAVASAPFGYAVVWFDGHDLHVARVTDSGAPIDAAALSFSPISNVMSVHVAVAGSAIFVVWSGNEGTFGCIVGSDRVFRTPQRFLAAAQLVSDVVSNGSAFALAFQTGAQIAVQRLGTDGQFIDATALRTGSTNGFPVHITCDGRDFLAVYRSGPALRLAWLPAAGPGLFITTLPDDSNEAWAGGAGGRYVLAASAAIYDVDAGGALRAKTATTWTNTDSNAVAPLDGGQRFLVVSSHADENDPRNEPRQVFWRIVE